MISAANVNDAILEVLGNSVQQPFPDRKVAEKLTAQENRHSIELSAYGYVMWALDRYGYKCAYKNVLSSDNAVDGYARAAVKFRDDMPAMLVNAHTYVSSILSNIADLDICLSQLEGMTFPYVLYVLFAGSGQQDVVARYRPVIEEQLRRYPSTLDLLPESYRKIREDIV